MAVSPILAKHLIEARAELTAERTALVAELDREIAQIDSILEGYSDAAPRPAKRAPSPSRAAGRPGSMRQVVLAWIDLVKGEASTAEIIDALAEQNEWAPASLRSLLARLVKEGALVSPRRGVYRLPEPLDASGAAAGAVAPEVFVTTSNEGGEVDDAEVPNPRDGEAGWHGGHRDQTVGLTA